MKIFSILNFLEESGIPFEFQGDPDTDVFGFSSLTHYKNGTVTWIKKQESIPGDFDPAVIRLCIVSEEVCGKFPNVIRTSKSKRAFFSAIEHFYGDDHDDRPVIGHGTYLSPKVKVGVDVHIGCNCTLDGEIIIGDHTSIDNNVSIIHHADIGQRTVIQSGVVIGHDDLAYTEEDGLKVMIRHYGGVKIGDDVTIGANTIINRGTIDDTVVGNNCIIDGQCHISHNVIMDDGVTLISGTRLYGSVHVEKNAYITSAIVKNQCTVGEDAMIGMGAVVTHDVPAQTTVVGIPAKPLTKTKNK